MIRKGKVKLAKELDVMNIIKKVRQSSSHLKAITHSSCHIKRREIDLDTDRSDESTKQPPPKIEEIIALDKITEEIKTESEYEDNSVS